MLLAQYSLLLAITIAVGGVSLALLLRSAILFASSSRRGPRPTWTS